jgi:hypothetical protein
MLLPFKLTVMIFTLFNMTNAKVCPKQAKNSLFDSFQPRNATNPSCGKNDPRGPSNHFRRETLVLLAEDR